jgi:hypothetical protein
MYNIIAGHLVISLGYDTVGILCYFLKKINDILKGKFAPVISSVSLFLPFYCG